MKKLLLIIFLLIPALGFSQSMNAVDLGLSVKWASCNVGATKPEGAGEFYAWGEVRIKKTFNFHTYFDTCDNARSFTKYRNNGGKTVLGPADDIASIKLGGKWRMPTKSEMEELRQKCRWKWTKRNGVKGYNITSKKNGKTIFLPAAGSRVDSGSNFVNSCGYYWSSTLYSDADAFAYGFSFSSEEANVIFFDRDFGRCIRAVCP